MPDNDEYEDVPEEAEAPDVIVAVNSYSSNSSESQEED